MSQEIFLSGANLRHSESFLSGLVKKKNDLLKKGQ